MSSFVDKLLGRRKPTSSILSNELVKAEAALRAAPERVARAEAALRNVAEMDDEEHAAAEIELASAQRAQVRCVAQVEQLRVALKQAEKAEAGAALNARAAAAARAVEDAPSVLAQYEQAAAAVAAIAGRLAAIDDEVRRVNEAIRLAQKDDPAGEHPSRVLGVSEVFLSEPGTTEPDTVVIDEVWQVPNSFDGIGWQGAGVFVERDGKRVPESPTARLVKRERIVPGRTRKGRTLPSPFAQLVLPAARLDAAPFWPKKA